MSRKPKDAPVEKPKAPDMPRGFAFIGSDQVQDPMQQAMDEAVAESNAAVLRRLKGEADA